MDCTRRELLAAAGLSLSGALLSPALARAQPTPKRGGTVGLRLWDPPHFDHMQIISYKTNVALSFTHSRLVKHKAGPAVTPGTFPIEGDLAESWSQPNDTAYVFKLRRGVRWHNKPPVNGRELTSADVVYSIERFLSIKGNSNAYMLRPVSKVEAPDRYTVKFTLSEPFAWFLDMLASPMAIAIVAREAVEKFGDLKRAEAVIGTGPWMLETYKPNVGLTFVRHPGYFGPGLPHIDRVEATVDEDTASRIAAFMAGKYDIGTENPGTINRTDWVQIKDKLRRKVQTAEMASNGMNHISMRTDQKPWSDVRVRLAISHAIDRQAMIDSLYEGVGAMNPAVPTGLKEWSIPMDRLGEGARAYAYDPAEAKRLLAAAGYPSGFPGSICFATYGSTVLVDSAQMIMKNLKDVGIDARLDQKEYGAYIATCFNGKFDSMTYGPQTPFVDPDNFLYAQYYPGEPKNQSHINDPIIADLLVRQRRTYDAAKRREVIFDIQRYLAKQQYYVTMPSGLFVAVWDAALRNYGPNLGYDWGGRLTAAWLDR